MTEPAPDVAPIRTARLTLESMSIVFMEALANDDVEAAGLEAGATVPADMPYDLRNFLVLRLSQLTADPSVREWLGRVMVLTDETGGREIIGSIGFHGPPDDERRLEVGYRVEPQHRRHGFASEAIRALFDWAHTTHSISRFVASISPDNEPSLRLARRFGFEKVGEQMDEIDGLEYVFETTWPPAPEG